MISITHHRWFALFFSVFASAVWVPLAIAITRQSGRAMKLIGPIVLVALVGVRAGRLGYQPLTPAGSADAEVEFAESRRRHEFRPGGRVAGASASSPECRCYEVDTHDVPPVLRQVDGVAASPATQIEHPPRRAPDPPTLIAGAGLGRWCCPGAG